MNWALRNTAFSLVLLISVSQIVIGQNNSQNKRIVEMTTTETINPAELIISQGEQITWQNNSGKIQTITVKTREENEKVLASAPKDAEPFSSGVIEPGESFSYTFYISGTYVLISLPNGQEGMSSRIIVKD